MLLPIKKGIIYGPVQSRRIGRSLGINLSSSVKKLCSLNCVYCQYGWTHVQCIELRESKHYPAVTDVLSELEQKLKITDYELNSITLSGNGEASLHPNFGQIVDGMIQLRNKYTPEVATAILSNSTQITDHKVRETIEKLDLKIMKLDCGTEKLFHQYNRPVCPIDFNSIINGLALLQDVTIQSLFSNGKEGNFNEEHIKKWIEKIQYISPKHVQIYTLARDYPAKKIFPLKKEELFSIKRSLDNANIDSEVYF